MKGFKSYYNNRKTENFIPHRFESKIEMIEGIPRILISKIAYNKMWHYVDLANEEVSWLGTVKRMSKSFLIEDVFLLKQEVSSTQTVITEDGLSEFGEGILKEPRGIDIYNNIRFWGHSHVNMDTGASGPDETQMDIFESSEHPFFIRGILNKRGKIEFTIYFYETGIKISDPEWSVYDPIDTSMRNVIEKDFNEKVTKEKFLNFHKYGQNTQRRTNINGPFKTNRPIQTGRI